MASLDSLKQMIRGIVDAADNVCKTFGISSPKNDDLFKLVCSLEFARADLAYITLNSV